MHSRFRGAAAVAYDYGLTVKILNLELNVLPAYQVIGLLLATVYFLWLGTLIVRSFTHIEAMNTEYIFIMVITLVTIVGAMSAVYTGALAPDQVSVYLHEVVHNPCVHMTGKETRVSHLHRSISMRKWGGIGRRCWPPPTTPFMGALSQEAQSIRNPL